MNLASRDYQEKRDFIRMRVEAPAAVELDNGAQLRGTCHNLSGGGMLLSLTETVAVGTQMKVAVGSNHSHSPMLKAVAQVVRLQKQSAEQSMVCKVGMAITKIID